MRIGVDLGGTKIEALALGQDGRELAPGPDLGLGLEGLGFGGALLGLRQLLGDLLLARGDLAVELSFEKLAEMQEEILWFGEACHLPVIWATQVLDSVAHTGLATRAEVTDAAMSVRADAVARAAWTFVHHNW